MLVSLFALSPLAQLLLLAGLVIAATPRATRLVTRDKIPLIAVPREVFVQRWGVWEDAVGAERKTSIGGKKTNIFMSSLAYLWECDWCTSVWVGGLFAGLTWNFPDVMLPVLLTLVASYAAGWGAEVEHCVDRGKREEKSQVAPSRETGVGELGE